MSAGPEPVAQVRRALLHVRHVTRFVYPEPVVEAHTEVRKTPVDTPRQRVVTHHLEVSPSAKLRRHCDYFGSRVHHFNLLEPHHELVIRSEAVVETRDGVGCRSQADGDDRPWSQRLAEYLHWSPAVPSLPAYAEIAHEVSVDLPAADFALALQELGGVFRRRFRYDPGATDVHSSPQVLFEKGGGVCQDLAHAMIGVLRLAGVPARYASGYIYDPERAAGAAWDGGAAASHAWVQAWHPELGWVGTDPTHERMVDWQYVEVAVGRDYGDVQPLRGVFVGSQEQRLEVEVRVERID